MISLQRFKTGANGTFGYLFDDSSAMVCFTVELPWLDNHPQTSCIPLGIYTVEPYQSPKHGDVWQIMNVPNRTNIEIHPANLASELLGCVGVGDSMGVINGLPAVMHSKNTFTMLKSRLPSSFQLTISDFVPVSLPSATKSGTIVKYSTLSQGVSMPFSGWKTILLSFATMALGILQSTDMTNFVALHPGPVTTGIGGLILLFRLITNTAPGIGISFTAKPPAVTPPAIPPVV